jgi:hypothetical protein
MITTKLLMIDDEESFVSELSKSQMRHDPDHSSYI